MKSNIFITLFLIPFIISSALGDGNQKKPRIIVSSDIGGSDFDDFQSMVHLFVYADLFDIEGIISSPSGDGRKEDILKVIDAYEKDYPNLITYSADYPPPDSLRKITKQGAIDIVSPIGFSEPTEGSKWIIACAKRDDPRPLHVLVWGGLEDLAQALHDAPEILPKLRVYWIGGPNKKWSVNAYQYIVKNFPELWFIESNATYRGWFTGGNQTGEWSNTAFVSTHVKGFGALGDFFYSKSDQLKMGDTPSLARFINGNPEDPSSPGWGGQYVRAWKRPYVFFKRLTTATDSMEVFGVLELHIPFDTTTVSNAEAIMRIDRDITGFVVKDTVIFLFSPKNAGKFSYKIISNIPDLNNKTGSITVYPTPETNKLHPAAELPNWWTDDPSNELKEGEHIGAKTVNKWRVDYLTDFAKRMERCKNPLNTGVQEKNNNMMPYNFKLYQNYPNPFNNSTTIRYSLPESENVTIEIYNILGQKVKTVIKDYYHEAGIYEMHINGDGLVSGTYIVRMHTNKDQMIKMILLK